MLPVGHHVTSTPAVQTFAASRARLSLTAIARPAVLVEANVTEFVMDTVGVDGDADSLAGLRVEAVDLSLAGLAVVARVGAVAD